MDIPTRYSADTEHGLLLALGEFAQQHGLIAALATVPIPQKTGTFPARTKLIELFVGIMSGITYLQDLNFAPHPLVADTAVATAWGQPGFAHFSTLSRALAAATPATVSALQQVVTDFSAPFVRAAVQDLLLANLPFTFDLDLTGQPVSPTSRTYPNAAFGWMDDQVQLGYQLARVCLHTRCQGRLWLAGFHHPGSTVSASCVRELILAAEAVARVRPRRRPELVALRLAGLQAQLAQALSGRDGASAKVGAVQEQWLALQAKCTQPPAEPPGPPRSRTRAEQQRAGWQARLAKLEHQLRKRQRILSTAEQQVDALRGEQRQLTAWQARLCTDNASNPDAPVCWARMDAGFASGRNLMWLLELGYLPDTKAPSDKTTRALRAQLPAAPAWERVGANAEMIDCGLYTLHECPYPLHAALERFRTGRVYKYATLLAYAGVAPRPSLPAWFQRYNSRQTIEAGNKELKGVFHVQHLMSRSAAGIQIQVILTGLAANLVRWARPWLEECTRASSPRWEQWLGSPKRLVQGAANTPAVVQRTEPGVTLGFTAASALPGVVLQLRGVLPFQPSLGFFQPQEVSSICETFAE